MYEEQWAGLQTKYCAEYRLYSYSIRPKELVKEQGSEFQKRQTLMKLVLYGIVADRRDGDRRLCFITSRCMIHREEENLYATTWARSPT